MEKQDKKSVVIMTVMAVLIFVIGIIMALTNQRMTGTARRGLKVDASGNGVIWMGLILLFSAYLFYENIKRKNRKK